MKKTYVSKLTQSMYETASGIHKAGLMSDRKFREFEKLCLKPESPSKNKKKLAKKS